MLAYVFWHWRQHTSAAQSYEADLIQFHRTLQANKPTGFQRSVVFSIAGAPWLSNDTSAYEEWYLLDNSAAMDAINHAAVNGPCEEPHNAVARQAAGGTAGLYRLSEGQAIFSRANLAIWFAKPEHMPYRDLWTTMKGICEKEQAALWTRQMVLGPTTEFCVHSTDSIQLPEGWDVLRIPISLLWPKG